MGSPPALLGLSIFRIRRGGREHNFSRYGLPPICKSPACSGHLWRVYTFGMSFPAKALLAFCLWLLLAAGVCGAAAFPAFSLQTPLPAPTMQTSSPAPSTQAATTYRLSPEKYEKAVAYSRARYRLYFISVFWNIAVILLLLRCGFFRVVRDFAVSRTAKRWRQAAILVLGVFGSLAPLDLPIRMYWHCLSLHYQQSVQPWGSWFRDWGKAELLHLALAFLVVLLLFGLIRRNARWWWFQAWLAAIPCTLFLVFIAPLYIDPLFNKFRPLDENNPQLVDSIVALTKHAGYPIPRDRVFLMDASVNTNAINAYVTGLGASKRIVVWDTSIQKTKPDELLYVVGHEMGHYVYHHVLKGTAFFLAMLLVALYLAHRLLPRIVARWGGVWGISGESDWAALGVLLLLLNGMTFFGAPIGNAFSRMEEHNADAYGLEVVQGLIPNANEVAAHSFQVLGEEDLDDPSPSKFIVFWLYSHPPLNERLRFVHEFKPALPDLVAPH
jgi:STE24 endopeptidase